MPLVGSLPPPHAMSIYNINIYNKDRYNFDRYEYKYKYSMQYGTEIMSQVPMKLKIYPILLCILLRFAIHGSLLVPFINIEEK